MKTNFKSLLCVVVAAIVIAVVRPCLAADSFSSGLSPSADARMAGALAKWIDSGELPGAISINPINWRRDETYAPASENLGSYVQTKSGKSVLKIPGVADAQVNTSRGVVVCTNTDEPYLDTDFSRTFYLTDTGRRWDGYKVSVRDKIPKYQEIWVKQGLSFHSTEEILAGLKNGIIPKRLMLTVHPQRWNPIGLVWCKELILQNAKNIVKLFIIKKS